MREKQSLLERAAGEACLYADVQGVRERSGRERLASRAS